MECPYCSAQVQPDGEDCPECGRPLALDAATVRWSAEDQDAATQLISSPGEEGGADGWSLPADQSKAQEVVLAAALEPGRRLGDRYEILQMLGEGGMGAVYKAKDVELDRLVALKVIRPELAKDPEVLQRFKQEIILAREVTHRNVIRIYDLGQADGIRFISMEYVEGEDLSNILKEKGKLSVEEAVQIMEQVCFALEEAHEEGVVHRDLKPQNIMIDQQGRVVVMDFGIARSMQITGVTQTGSLLGTPDYMSPEQVKGEHVDSRSDIFALGVILFQLLTGEVPYKSDSAMSAMYMRTQERAKPVRELSPDVPGFLDDVIARCLEISPQRRYQSARELVQDLEVWRGGTPRTMSVTFRHFKTVRRNTKRRIAMAVGAVAVIAALVGGVSLYRSRVGPEPTVEAVPSAEEMTSLAILPFQNVSGAEEVAWLSSGLADMLLTDVGQSAYLRTVSSERLHEVRRDLGLAGEASLDSSARRRLAEVSNAQILVTGQYVKVGDQIRIDATVEDVEQGIRTPVKVEAASESELLQAVEQLAGLVRDNLALSSERVEELEGQGFRPSSDSVAAVRFYLQGRELMRQGNNLEALAQFESSIAEDSGFALAYSELGEANLIIGHGQEAEEHSRKAVELSEDLPSQERNLILAQDARITNDLEAGVEAYENLLRFRPNDPDLHYELGALYENEGLYDQAQEHYARTLLADPQNLSAQLATGRALALQGDASGALQVLGRAEELAVEVGNREVEANVLHNMGLAYEQLDQLEEALQVIEKSMEIKRELGDKRGMAASFNEIAIIQDLLGNWDEARASYRETVELGREIGDKQGVGITLMNMGNMERSLGNYDDALQLTRQALRIQIDTNDELNQGTSLNNIGAVYYMQGKYDDALVYYQQALEIREHLEVPSEIADTLHNIGETYTAVGDFERALDQYLRALEIRRADDDRQGAALESYYMGRVFTAQGRYSAALTSIAEAARTYRELQDRSAWFAESLAWQGRALSLLGRFEEADVVFDEALALSEEWQDEWLVAQVLNFQGERLYYAGEMAAAGTTLGRALELAQETGDPQLILISTISRTKVDIQSGRPAQAVADLESAIEEAETLGLRVLSTECRIHLGAALMGSRETDRAKEVLEQALRESEDLASLPLQLEAHHYLALLGQEPEASKHASAAARLLAKMREEAGSDSLLQRSDLKAIGATG